MGRSKSSSRWLAEHFSDAWVQKAQEEGWRSRAVFKLQEVQDRHALIKAGMTVVDLGAAPGGWSQLAARLVSPGGRVYALDILPMEAVAGVTFIQGDFTEEKPLAELETRLADAAVDVVLSDMAPNISGMAAVDQPRAIYLAELAHEFARQWLKPGGDLVVKVFQGEGCDEFVTSVRADFSRVKMFKPKASRSRSREMYVMARGRTA